MRRIAAVVAGQVLVLTLGIGTASAQPDNGNVRAIPGAHCDGQSVDLVTMFGAAAWNQATGAVFVLKGVTVDGAWTVPIPNGQASKALSTCSYDNFGPHITIYGSWETPH